jgi:hypothetical protein
MRGTGGNTAAQVMESTTARSRGACICALLFGLSHSKYYDPVYRRPTRLRVTAVGLGAYMKGAPKFKKTFLKGETP